MALSYRDRKKWQQVWLVTLLAVVVGLSYTAIRMYAGIMPVTFAQFENASRTGAFIGFCLGWFMIFVVYDTPGEVFRRMGFVKGWLALEFVSVTIIVFCMALQRMVSSILWPGFGTVIDYFKQDLLIDLLIALFFFLLITFHMQLRRLVARGRCGT